MQLTMLRSEPKSGRMLAHAWAAHFLDEPTLAQKKLGTKLIMLCLVVVYELLFLRCEIKSMIRMI